MDIGGSGSLHDFLHGGFRHGIADVFGNSAVKEKCVLQDRGNVSSQTFQGHLPEVAAIDQDPAGNGLIKPRDQLGKRRFSDACRTYKSEHLSWSAPEGYVLQDRRPFSIGKADMIEDDLSLHICEVFCAGPVLNLHRRVQNIQHPLRACHGLLHVFQQVGKPGYRHIEQSKIQQKRHDILNPQSFPEGQKAAEGNHQDRSKGRDEFHGGMEYSADLQCLQHCFYMVKIPFIHLPGFVLFTSE